MDEFKSTADTEGRYSKYKEVQTEYPIECIKDKHV